MGVEDEVANFANGCTKQPLHLLSSLFEVALDGGQRHPQHADDLAPWLALVHRAHHSFSQIG